MELKAKEADGDELCLRIEVVGTQGVDYLYDLAFATLDEAVEGDSVATVDELSVIVPANSVSKLMGATLDLPSGDQAGLVLRNPNRPNPLAGEEVELSGTTEEKINQLLEQSINPALASHGGFAVLERVEDRDEGVAAVVTMGGGCQGCAVSAITLREGIEAAIKEAIPEVVEIVDGTDHDAGENPYFT
jgi:Fe/S biogenesis protein NfuA